MIASDLHNPFFADLLDAVQVTDEVGIRTLLGTGRRRPEQERQLVESLIGHPVDGLLLLSPLIDAADLRDLSRRSPIVVTGRSDITSHTVDTVVNNDAAGAALAVEHLISLGHRRITHITGGNAPAAAERERGFRDAMTAAGLSEYMRLVPGGVTDEDGYDAMTRLIAAGGLPTAVFAVNDFAALGALNAIEEDGMSVPEDVSLVGYDNSSIAAFRHVSLTSIDQPHAELGRLAVRTLYERVTAENVLPAEHIVLTPRFVARATTAAPS